MTSHQASPAGRGQFSRRTFLAGAAGLALTPMLARAAEGKSAYIAPTGDGDGSTPELAAPLQALGDLIKTVGAGGVVFLFADRGDYGAEKPIHIAAGGADGAPVRIMGVDKDLKPKRAILRGTRKKWRKPASQKGAANAKDFGGNVLFEFAAGSSFLSFSSLSVVGVSSIFDFSDAKESGITVEDVDFYNVRDGFYTNEGSALNNVVLRRFNGVGFSKKGVRFHGSSQDWLIEDCELDSGWQFGDSFAVGIELNHTANGLQITGGFCINCFDNQDGDQEKYWNADGVASERGNHNIRITNHHSAGHSDGGYDFKSEDTILTGCTTEDNKRNYRIWGGKGTQPIILDNCSSKNPHSRGGTGGSHHLWTSGSEGEDRHEAASVLALGGSFEGDAANGMIYADGANVAVHLVDTKITGLKDPAMLFVAAEASSKLIQGSAKDAGVTEITTAPEQTAIEGLHKSIPLLADGPATWRIVDAEAHPDYSINGDILVFAGTKLGDKAAVTVQARDSRGATMTKDIVTTVAENPVGEGTVLDIDFDGPDGAQEVADRTTLNVIKFAGTAALAEGALRFDGGENYVFVDDSDEFTFSGPFTLDAVFRVDHADTESGQDIVSHWGDSSNQRSYVLRVEPDAKVSFSWTYDGKSDNIQTLTGPVLESDTYYFVRVDRDAEGTVRLYVDGKMVAKEANAGQPLMNSSVPFRISGRASGKWGATGYMRSISINNGIALTGSDNGYEPA